jgi:hypothetical protein
VTPSRGFPLRRCSSAAILVEYNATPYTGDAYLTEWPQTLDRVAALGAERLVPGRGDALTTPATGQGALDGTRAFVTQMYESVKAGRAAGKPLKQVYAETYAWLKPEVRRVGDLRPLSPVRREPAPMTRRAVSVTRASGPRSATPGCGRTSRSIDQ